MLNFIRRRRDAQRAETERIISDTVDARVTQLQADNRALHAEVDRLNARVDALLLAHGEPAETLRTYGALGSSAGKWWPH